ncbi:hypothetical protein Hdeb2414_s0011g00374841 [Helianthus debilis subsp. tardiflorus]
MTSDYDAISIIFDVHKYAKTPKDAVAEVVKQVIEAGRQRNINS